MARVQRAVMMLYAVLVLTAVVSLLLWLRRRRSLLLNDWQRRCVFITGCDHGFGHQMALRLDKKGVPVFAGCFTEQGCRDLAEKSSDMLKTLSLDVTSTQSILKAYQFICDNIPSGCYFWGVVNNAGLLGIDGSTEFFTRDDYRRLMEVNLFGMTDVNTIFLPLLKKSAGRIVNMGSIAGVAIYPRLAPYVASKHAVVAYSEVLRLEKSVWGIKVSTVEPGGYKTNIINPEAYKEAKERQWLQVSQEVRDEYGRESFDESSAGTMMWQVHKAKTDYEPVLWAYEHGLFAVHPKAHYMPDKMSKAMFCIYHLPRFVYDKMMIKRLIFRKGNMPQILLDKQKEQ